MLAFLMTLAAVVCFALAAFSVPTRRVNMVGLGLLFMSLVWLMSAATAAGVRFG